MSIYLLEFRSEVDVSKKQSDKNEVGYLKNVFENKCVGRPFTVDFFTCKSYGNSKYKTLLYINKIAYFLLFIICSCQKVR